MTKIQAQEIYRQADSLFRQGKAEEALGLLDELAKHYPDEKTILFARARCLQSLGRMDDALSLYERLEIVFADARAGQARAEILAGEAGEPVVRHNRSKGGRWRLILGIAAALSVLLLGAETVRRMTYAIPSGVFLVRQGSTGTVAPDGLSWQNAFPTIQEGVDAAYRLGGGEVWVAEGTFDEQRDSGTGAVVMKPGVRLYGGFAGAEKRLTERRPNEHPTIIDGSKARGGHPAYHVIEGEDGCLLDSLTIRGGRADGGDKGLQIGGGVFVGRGAGIEIVNCVITGNAAAIDGGGIWNNSDTLVFRDCLVAENSATFGGGMYNFESSPQVLASVFQRNNAWECGGGSYNAPGAAPLIEKCRFEENTAAKHGGGGTHNNGSSPVFRNCVFLRNSAVGSGGAMQNVSGYANPVVEGCVFEENQAEEWDGGAIHNWGQAHVSLENCIFRANRSRHGGGMYIGDQSTARVVSCTFAQCEARALGGAIAVFKSTAEFINCLVVWNNVMQDSGGACVWEGSFGKFINCTFAENNAQTGNTSVDAWNNANVELVNCILWSEPPVLGVRDNSVAALSFCDIQGGYPGVGNMNTLPKFRDMENGDFRLQQGSGCIDTGIADGAPPEDMEGILRPQGAGVDMGAHEFPSR